MKTLGWWLLTSTSHCLNESVRSGPAPQARCYCFPKGYVFACLSAGDSLGRIAISLMAMCEVDLAEAQKEVDEFVRTRSHYPTVHESQETA